MMGAATGGWHAMEENRLLKGGFPMKLTSLLTALLFFAMVMTPPASAETTLFEGW